ncbi:MAG: hypothetical protein NT098_04405 [Candidatus Parcubacteria bacterium]|nr:hypothetical protein [Candidatus Parcubacteria bacterium]
MSVTLVGFFLTLGFICLIFGLFYLAGGIFQAPGRPTFTKKVSVDLLQAGYLIVGIGLILAFAKHLLS